MRNVVAFSESASVQLVGERRLGVRADLGGAALQQQSGGDRADGDEALGRAAERRRAGEAEQPDDEDRLAPEQVTDPPAEQQQAAEGERVGGDDPLARVVGEPEVLLRAWRRVLGIVLDGLRASREGPSKLAVPAIQDAQLERAVTQRPARRR